LPLDNKTDVTMCEKSWKASAANDNQPTQQWQKQSKYEEERRMEGSGKKHLAAVN
jgi:hypothetical protein